MCRADRACKQISGKDRAVARADPEDQGYRQMPAVRRRDSLWFSVLRRLRHQNRPSGGRSGCRVCAPLPELRCGGRCGRPLLQQMRQAAPAGSSGPCPAAARTRSSGPVCRIRKQLWLLCTRPAERTVCIGSSRRAGYPASC